LYFPEENFKKFYQDEIIEILDQAKAKNPEWHEAMVNESFRFLKCVIRNQYLISRVWRT
jgi:hypothetical protein